MKYTTANGRVITIPDSELNKCMEKLQLTHDEAVQMWLEDNEIEVNQEQAELDKKAKSVKIQHGASTEKERKPPKPRTVKTSDEKKALFNAIVTRLDPELVENIEILKENKLIQCQVGEKLFKIDLIEVRKK